MTTELSPDATLILLVSCAWVLGLALGALVGWILRDRAERRALRPADAGDLVHMHNARYHPGQLCRENRYGACADRFGEQGRP